MRYLPTLQTHPKEKVWTPSSVMNDEKTSQTATAWTTSPSILSTTPELPTTTPETTSTATPSTEITIVTPTYVTMLFATPTRETERLTRWTRLRDEELINNNPNILRTKIKKEWQLKYQSILGKWQRVDLFKIWLVS